MQKNQNKCEMLIADSSDAMSLTLWEGAIDRVEVGQSYRFGDLRVFLQQKIP